MRKFTSSNVSLLSLLVAVATPACSTSSAEPEAEARLYQAFSVASNVFINELHYDNDGTDAGEAIEVVGPAETDLTGWSLVLYNGNGGALYDTVPLSGVLSDQEGGYGTFVATFPSNGIQNGSPDGVALVDGGGNVVEFLSYEGPMQASDGPAAGLDATDIGVSETSTTPAGYSLARTGTGLENSDFTWQTPAASSFGAINPGQNFGPGSSTTGTGGAGTDGGTGSTGGGEPGPSAIFFNELHYDNDSTDTGEGFEIAGPAGADLTGYQVALYNGSNGAVYDTVLLGGVIPNLGGGAGVISVERAGIQNGSPDGLALVDPEGHVLQFLSYEGSFTAVGGPADGLTSEDIGVSEPSNSPVGESLQLVGTGSLYSDFAWAPSAPQSFGAVNPGQTFTGGGDAAPGVAATSPTNGDYQVAPGTQPEVTFSEPVVLAAGALSLTCNGVPREVTIQGGPETFTLSPVAPLAAGDSCSVDITAAAVSDLDTEDPPDTLPRDVGVSFDVPVAATIAQVQGASHWSPYEGRVVEVVGVVTVVQNNGLYVQSEKPDKDDATSEGLFVFTGSTPDATAGDQVRAVGRVSEYRAGCTGCSPSDSAYNNLTITEIDTPNTVEVLASGHAVPAPTLIGQGGRRPPRKVIDDDAQGSVEVAGETVFDPKKDGIDFYESLESMLVRVDDAIAVSATSSFGEIAVLADGGRHANKLSERGSIVVRPNDFNPERMVVDDALIFDEPQVHVGARFVEPIVGVMSYSFANYKLNNTVPLVVEDATALERETLCVGDKGADQLDLASFNVENLSPSDSPDKFAALANIVVDHLGSPDILSLEEVQDNTGPTNDGTVDASLTLENLVQAIAVAGGPLYAYAEVSPEDGRDGGQPGGNIRVAFLYDTSRGLSFVERPGAGATTPNQVVDEAGSVHLLYSPGRLDPENPAFENSRKPLAAEFSYRDQTFFVVANHFNSKGGDQPLFGRFQPPELTSEVQRLAQAGVVADFVEQILSVDKKAAIVVMGDLNDFWFSPPLEILEAAGLKNPMRGLPPEERYTYVYDGNAQALDHILLSRGARHRGFEYDIVHVNAEFFDQVSDHDPSVVRLRFR